MIGFYGWIPGEPRGDAPRVLAAMREALRADPAAPATEWAVGGLVIGAFDVAPLTGEATPDRSALWAGLFDLRDNLLGQALEDLRVLSVI